MKKKRYELKDGGIINAACACEFVTLLREGSLFDSECNNSEYMQNFAERYKIQSGHLIRADSAVHFLEDIIRTGYIQHIHDIEQDS
jgi:hypothetical protein